MPKILFINGYSFLFFSNEGFERIHVHIAKGDAEAKFWMEPVLELDYSEGFNPTELRFIKTTLNENRDFIILKWNEYFNR
ncbi:DUF4160 domain-containing protein [bacterium]|nr:DUF4160 domain-containing protein [bacterium]